MRVLAFRKRLNMEKLEGSVMEYVRKMVEVMLGNSGRKDVEAEQETLGKKLNALRKGIERIRVFGEGRIEVVWKGGDMFGGENL